MKASFMNRRPNRPLPEFRSGRVRRQRLQTTFSLISRSTWGSVNCMPSRSRLFRSGSQESLQSKARFTGSKQLGESRTPPGCKELEAGYRRRSSGRAVRALGRRGLSTAMAFCGQMNPSTLLCAIAPQSPLNSRDWTISLLRRSKLPSSNLSVRALDWFKTTSRLQRAGYWALRESVRTCVSRSKSYGMQ